MLKVQSFFMSLLLMGSGMISTACNDDNDNNGGPNWAQATELVVNKTSLALAGTQPGVLVVKSPAAPTVSSDAAWLTINTIQHRDGSNSIYDVEIVAEPNPTYEARTATLTVRSGSQTATVAVTQYQGETVNVLNVDPSADLDPAGGVLRVTFEATGDVSVAIPDWMTKVEARSIEQSVMQFRYGANVRSEARGGDIVISLVSDPSVSAVVTVSQNVLSDSEMNSTAKQIASQIVAGVNIGNTLEALSDAGPSETAWGNPKVSLQYIQGLKAAGFNAVRVPCAWDGYVIDREKNTIDPAWLDRVDEVVSYIIGEGMFAIVNIHYDGGWLESSCANGYDAAVDQKQRDYWTQIAEKLNHYGEKLLFAGMNEPGQQNQTAATQQQSVNAIMAYQQTFVDAVRATGGNNATRCLIHQTPFTNIDEGVKGLYSMPTDVVADRALVEVHFYDPSDFTIMEKDGDWAATIKLYWGKDNFVEGSDRNCTWADEAYIDAQFKKMQDAYVAKGVPVILGEYAADANRTSIPGIDIEKWKASRAYWTEYVTKSAKVHGCVPFLWETGGDIDRYSGNVKNKYAIDALMNGAANGIYPF